MKILAALVTALTLVGFGGAVVCRLRRPYEAQRARPLRTGRRILPPDDKTS